LNASVCKLNMSSLEERTGNVRAKRSAVLQSAERAVGRECITPQNKHIWYISRGTSRQKSSNRVHRGPARSGKPPPGARESFDLDFCCRWVDRLMPAPTWHQTRRRRNDSPPWFCPAIQIWQHFTSFNPLKHEGKGALYAPPPTLPFFLPVTQNYHKAPIP